MVEMKRLISQKRAINIMIVLLTVVMIFHLLVLIGAIPYIIVWAGKIKALSEMKKLETISILVNAFAIFILALKANYLKHKVPSKILNTIILFFAVLFSLNTIGNLFAESRFELYFFTPLTFISAGLCLRIVSYKS